MSEHHWLPYCGAAPLPEEWLNHWNGDPVLLVALLGLAIWSYARDRVEPKFYAGFALLIILFVTPLCALSSALFSVRVGHHIILTALAAPLLLSALPIWARRGNAVWWTGAHILLFWFWHAPEPYALALTYDGIFWLMQLSLLISAMGFWSSLSRTSHVLGVGLLLMMMVQMGLLGALLTFASDALYAPHSLTTLGWGLRPLEDQQIAGLLMWAPASAFYLAAALKRGWHMLDAEAVPA